MSNSPRISVIVPVYNVKDYLKDCLDSLVSQTLPDLEIILVDDGSNDGSGLLCDEYAERYRHIRVIHQENAGLSDARNAGIDSSSGTYLMFVDSDDTVEPELCRKAYDAVRKGNTDIAVFGYDRIDVQSMTISYGDLFYRGDLGTLTRVEAMICLASGDIRDFAWNKIYRRELFEGIRYPSGESWEDMAISYMLFDRACRVLVIPDILYHYRNRSDSLMATAGLTGEFIVDGRRNDEYAFMLIHCPEAADTMKSAAAKQDLKCCVLYANRHEEMFETVRRRLVAKDIRIRDLGLRFWVKVKVLKFIPALFLLIRKIKDQR